MKHRERTADANYVLRPNASQASTAHQLMNSIIHERILAVKHPRKLPALLKTPMLTHLKRKSQPKNIKKTLPRVKMSLKGTLSEEDSVKGRLNEYDKVVILCQSLESKLRKGNCWL